MMPPSDDEEEEEEYEPPRAAGRVGEQPDHFALLPGKRRWSTL